MCPKLARILLALQMALFCGGCGPRLSQKDLGTVLYQVPQVPGSDKEFVVPGLADEPDEPEPPQK